MRLKIFFTVLVVSVAFPTSVLAITNLVQIEIRDGNHVNLHFDKIISKKQAQVEFFKDIIQVTLTQVSVYPAKIIRIPGKELVKVFSYQYTPEQVRCRFTVKGLAEKLQNRFQIKLNGKILNLELKDMKKDTVASVSSASEQVMSKPVQPSQAIQPTQLDDKVALEEKLLIANVLKKVTQEKHEAIQQKPLRQVASKNIVSPYKVFAILLGMVLMFGCVVLLLQRLFKKINRQKDTVGSPFRQLIKKIASPLGFGNNEKWIEVVANHYLGPKKSILVVRIAGKLLVLGVSQESIQLISQLNDMEYNEQVLQESEPKMGLGAQSADTPMFFDLLGKETTKPSIRSAIRSKVEGLKPL
ncbi:MAG: flagellar biosynthetic protein FliO [Deltaproteobacteria bacterium]|nr:flagellar biosynthetic protein FliO [Deltaproteobacteria bacterium]